MSYPTLTLNADGLPTSIIPLSTETWKDSIKLLYIEHAYMIAEYEDWEVHSPSTTIKVPSVIMLRDYVKVRRSVKFCKENIYLRDGYVCQYCNASFLHDKSELSQDHVIPKFLNGKTNWTNIVTSCNSCNLEKSHFMKMKPKIPPKRPTYYELAAKSMSMPITVPHASWIDYIGWPPELVTVKSPTKQS